MKNIFLSIPLLIFVLATAHAQVVQLSGVTPGREGSEASIVQKGDRLRLQTITPLTDRPDEVTVIAVGPKAWVLCEYERKFVRRNAEGATEDAKETVQLWVNFDHVIAASKVTPKK